MASLGSFGTPATAVDDTFDYFGCTFRVNPHVTDLALYKVAQSAKRGAAMVAASEAATAGDPSAVGDVEYDFAAEVTGILAPWVHPDDVEPLIDVAIVNGQSFLNLAELVNQLIGAIGERPTARPAGSSGGPTSTGTRSVPPDVVKAMAAAAAGNNPNLELVIWQAEEAASARQVS